ncbi:MAG: OmpH family outer membrane protein [Paracoccus sp. (in: a-proteobacteria)]|nr:OmpH family outer membrane protein [Paracoccus sp. (in: a-proteobacteria)]
MRHLRRHHGQGAALALLLATALPVTAQEPVPPASGLPGSAPFALSPGVASPILTVDINALFAGSAWGKRFQAEFEAASRGLSEENDRIYAELAAEERALTEARPRLTPEEFRSRADAFDQKVQKSRRDWEVRRRDLTQRPEAELEAFRAAALPVFDAIMRERAALAILDQRMVFLSRDAVDVTAPLIARIDAQIGQGPPMAPLVDPASLPPALTEPGDGLLLPGAPSLP